MLAASQEKNSLKINCWTMSFKNIGWNRCLLAAKTAYIFAGHALGRSSEFTVNA